MLTHTTTNSYITDRFSFLRLVEAYRQYAYADVKGIATIGIGFNMNLNDAPHQTKVLQLFGFDLDRNLRAQGAIQADAAEQEYIARIRAALNKVYAKNDTAALQSSLRQIMTERFENQIYPPDFSRRREFKFIGSQPDGADEAKSIFDQLMAGYPGFTGYEPILDNWLNLQRPYGSSGELVSIAQRQPALLNKDSRERLALISMAWQGFINARRGRPVGQTNLARALVNDDRAEAWYEIRYTKFITVEQNGVKVKVYEARNLLEADTFGLYEPGYGLTMRDVDAKGALRTYTRHQKEIDAREQEYLSSGKYVTAKRLGYAGQT